MRAVGICKRSRPRRRRAAAEYRGQPSNCSNKTPRHAPTGSNLLVTPFLAFNGKFSLAGSQMRRLWASTPIIRLSVGREAPFQIGHYVHTLFFRQIFRITN